MAADRGAELVGWDRAVGWLTACHRAVGTRSGTRVLPAMRQSRWRFAAFENSWTWSQSLDKLSIGHGREVCLSLEPAPSVGDVSPQLSGGGRAKFDLQRLRASIQSSNGGRWRLSLHELLRAAWGWKASATRGPDCAWFEQCGGDRA